MSDTPKTEAFIEQLPDDEPGNLRHWQPDPEHFGRHFTGSQCPCEPTVVAHLGIEVSS